MCLDQTFQDVGRRFMKVVNKTPSGDGTLLTTNFERKLAARRVPSPDGVFINDLHDPSARILEGSIQTHPDADPTLGGSDPGAPTTASPTDVAMVALDQAD